MFLVLCTETKKISIEDHIKIFLDEQKIGKRKETFKSELAQEGKVRNVD